MLRSTNQCVHVAHAILSSSSTSTNGSTVWSNVETWRPRGQRSILSHESLQAGFSRFTLLRVSLVRPTVSQWRLLLFHTDGVGLPNIPEVHFHNAPKDSTSKIYNCVTTSPNVSPVVEHLIYDVFYWRHDVCCIFEMVQFDLIFLYSE